MARLLITLAGGAVALVIGAAVALVLLASSIDLKGKAVSAIETATGRTVEIRGKAGFTLFPTLGLHAEDVRIANAPGGRAPEMIAAKRVEVGVDAGALMQRRLQVTALHLIDPEIALEILPDGSPNWMLKPAAPRSGAPQSPGVDTHVNDVRLSGVSIESGRITFFNARSQLAYTLESVNADIELAGLDKPLSLRGDAIYNGEHADLGASLTTPRALLAANPVGLSFNLESAPLKMNFTGAWRPGAASLQGALEASGPDLRRVAAWAGNPIGAGDDLKAFSVKGQLVYAEHSTAFNNATVSLDALAGRGDVLIETTHAKPFISGRLQMASLDLNPYLAHVRTTAPPPAASSVAPASAAPAGPPPAASGLNPIDVRKTGYDSAPLDYSGLRAVNANLDLIVGALQVQKLRIDRARVGVVLSDGFLAATLSEMELYGGHGSGKVRIDARASPLRFEETLDVDSLRAQPFFTDALGFSAIDATANVTLALRSEGESQRELIGDLSGDGAFYFGKGSFRGVDFGGVTRTVSNVIKGRVAGPNAQTAFNTFAATLQIAHGVAVTRDFKLDGPRLLVTAQGQIDMAGQNLDLRFTPRTVFTRNKDTGQAKLTGLPMPVRAVGRWTALKYTTDIGGKGKREEEREICSVTHDC